MVHTCTPDTDLDELIGQEQWEGNCLRFRYGPLATAMRTGDELILENSGALSALMLANVRFMLGAFFIDDTAELVEPQVGFHLTLR